MFNLAELLRQHEGKTLEFKRDLSSPDKVMRTLVAFANGAGGRLLIGIEDGDSSPSAGQTVPPELLDRLRKRIGELTVNVQAYPAVQLASNVTAVSAGYAHTVMIRQTEARMTNLAVRSNAGTGAQTLIVGLAVGGSGQKPLVVRGVGPTLATFGVPGALADPQVRLFNSNSVQLLENNDWGGSTALVNAFAAAGAFALPTTSKDAALLPSLAVGGYTVHVTSTAGTGVALMEAFDTEPLSSSARLVNVSTRTQVGSGADILILGLTITGNGPKTLLIRAIGPTLANFGVGGVLADPQMDVYSGSTRISGNDNWGGSPGLIAAFQTYGAFSLLPSTRDAALVTSLPPGGYTVQVRGVGDTTGVALVEVYELP